LGTLIFIFAKLLNCTASNIKNTTVSGSAFGIVLFLTPFLTATQPLISGVSVENSTIFDITADSITAKCGGIALENSFDSFGTANKTIEDVILKNNIINNVSGGTGTNSGIVSYKNNIGTTFTRRLILCDNVINNCTNGISLFSTEDSAIQHNKVANSSINGYYDETGSNVFVDNVSVFNTADYVNVSNVVPNNNRSFP